MFSPTIELTHMVRSHEGKTILDWRGVGVQWALNQGVAVVMLGVMLYGGWYAATKTVPQHIEKIIASQAESFNDRTKAIVESHDKDREFYKEQLDRAMKMIEEKQNK